MQRTAETLQPDLAYRMRQRIGPWLTRLARKFWTPEYRLRDTGYVGTVEQPLDEFTETLRDHGFVWDPLAWYHQPPVGSSPNGSWTFRRSLFADRQTHVILIAHSPKYVDVYAHEEYNWLRHPIKHLRQVGVQREVGSREVRRWLERLGISVDVRSRPRRKVANAVADLRQDIASMLPHA